MRTSESIGFRDSLGNRLSSIAPHTQMRNAMFLLHHRQPNTAKRSCSQLV
ncbi:hypothetical protein [Microcoleus sp. Pol14C4]